MRQRLLWSTLGVIAAALVALALPLAILARNVLRDRAADALTAEVENISGFVESFARGCDELQLQLERLADDPGAPSMSLLTPQGALLLPRAGEVALGDEFGLAVAGRTSAVVGAERIRAATPLDVPGCPSLILHVARSDDALERQVRASWVGIAATSSSVLLLAAAAALWQGRRLADPFERLARTARALGEGDFSTRAPRSGLPEADAIADALDTTAERLGRALDRAGALTADASHQLRTPLTALRLHLESLEGTADPSTLAAALAEADRLEATVEELVALTRTDDHAGPVDLAALVRERAPAWRGTLDLHGRDLRLVLPAVPPVRARPGAVSQALQVLVDNALEHGAGTVTVSVTADVGSVRACVSDEGPGIPAEAAAAPRGRDRGGTPVPPLPAGVRPRGRGLPLARSLVAAEGGRLVLGAAGDASRACIVLPTTEGPAS